jgi:signal transduction histidine kinase
VLVIQAVLLLPLPWAAAVTAAVPLVHVGMSWSDGVRSGIGTFVAAVFTLVLTTLHEREQRARAELAEVNAQLRRYAEQAEELAATRERNRVARDIHDGLGHHLTVVQMQLQAVAAVLDTDRARAVDLLAKAQRQSQEALADVRRSVTALREPRNQGALPDVLRTLATESTEAGVTTVVEVRGERRDLPAETEESLYRVAQEGLTNVRKHARAGSARVVLDYGNIRTVRVEVRDDGRGAPGFLHRPSGYGLTGLRERVTSLGGRLTVDSTPGNGLALSAELPG